MQKIMNLIKKIFLFLKAILLSIINFFLSPFNNIKKKQENQMIDKKTTLSKIKEIKDATERIDTSTKKSFFDDLLKTEEKRKEELLKIVKMSFPKEETKYSEKIEKIKNELKEEITKGSIKTKKALKEKITEKITKELIKEKEPITLSKNKNNTLTIKETNEKKLKPKLEQTNNIMKEKEMPKPQEEKVLGRMEKKKEGLKEETKESLAKNITLPKKISVLKEERALSKTTFEKKIEPENLPKETKTELPKEKAKAEKPKTEEPQKQEIKLEEENIKKIEEQTKKLEKNILEELSKKDFLEIDYDRLEEEIKKQKAKINHLLEKNLTPLTKEQLKKEANKLNILERKIKEKKYDDLKEITLPLEEQIDIEEIEKLKESLEKLEISSLKEIESLLNNEQIGKEEKRNLEKIVIKEKMKQSSRFNIASIILGLPFIKNKYFLNLVSGLFLFQQFKFIKRILFKNSKKEERENLLNIQKGADALYEASLITHNNILEFEELREMVFLKYPELQLDEEFNTYLKKVEKNLYKSYKSILKENKKISKYLKKEKKLKLERRKFYEFN